ncbi:MAG: FAD binding domain-containing protein [Hyphomicrobiales bacterium]|nr:FAD binding domain-containing protein [Hyphomicrobiales bacterium]
MLTCDQYHMPSTLSEAFRLLRMAPDGSRLIAGATDILPWAREGRAGDVHIPELIDITRIDELSGYQINDGRVRLGTNIVYQQFLTDEALRRHLPCMPYCSIWFADDQIREQATLAGNIVNASPAGDGMPPVIAMNGAIEIARMDGADITHRTLPVADFIQGPGKTGLQPGEIVTAIICDSLEGYGGAFEKVGQRRSLVISSVCAAAVVKTDPTQKIFEDVRLALGGVGPVPLRLTDVEEQLKGQIISRELIATVSEAPQQRVASRSRVEYRRNVVRGFVEAALENALIDCGVNLPDAELAEASHA